MYGQVSVKSIIVGLLVKFFAGVILGAIAGGIAGAASLGSMVRTMPKSGAMNSVQSTQMGTTMMTTLFSSPLFIVATILAAVLAALLAGYVTGLLAPGSEIKNATIVIAIFVGWTLLTSLRATPTAAPATAPMLAAAASLRWIILAGQALSVPALLAGAALAARRSAPSPRYENSDSFQQ